MLNSKKILKGLGIAVFAVVFVGIGMYLFFEDTFDKIAGVFEPGQDGMVVEELVLVEPLPLQTFEPTTFDSATRQRLNQIYESLIKPDRDLNMRPALALNWGLLDDVTWEFNLRKEVKFHDGSPMKVEDVIGSIDRARSADESQLKDLLSTIKEVRRVDAWTIEIETYEPDPLLLSRLATVYVVPEGWSEGDTAPSAHAVGTGAYRVAEYSDGDLKLELFDGYWGDQPQIKKAVIKTILDPLGRLSALVSGEADVLSYVPYDLVGQVDAKQFDLVSVPSLEVQFLMFNFESTIFDDVNVRRAVAMAIDRDEFAGFVGEYAHEVKQFVSSGVFGYNPDIEENEYDLDEAEKLVKKAGVYGEEVVILLPLELSVLGDYLTQQFGEIGLDPYIQYVQGQYYVESLEKTTFDMYFMGFKSELGDAGDFLKSVAHSGESGYGQYNFAGYENSKVDALIEEIEVEMKVEDRLAGLQEAMRILVEDDVVGVPLLEYETVFAAILDLEFEPRIDGFIYLNEL